MKLNIPVSGGCHLLAADPEKSEISRIMQVVKAKNRLNAGIFRKGYVGKC